MGGRLHFVLTIEMCRPVIGIQFGIFVHSTTGEPIIELRSSHNGLYFDSSGGRITVEVSVDNFGLYPGEYTLVRGCVTERLRSILIGSSTAANWTFSHRKASAMGWSSVQDGADISSHLLGLFAINGVHPVHLARLVLPGRQF